jgi:hypothetical protein
MNEPEIYGIPVETIALLCKVDVRTARRWKNGERRMPKTARMILAGDLGAFDPAWRGWRAHGGKLISEEGWEITVRDMLASPLMRQQLAAYKGELEQLRDVRAFMNWLGATLGQPIEEMVGDGAFTELTTALLQQVLLKKAIPLLQQASERAAGRLADGNVVCEVADA